ncbi:MAG: NAD+ synthase [Bacteroidales bacterium]|jgi:NAD+ synthase (glutamine-hydrolysing)|nr:NAD+ synthase [Bacteroidales bacterium]MDD3664332.1 NAD+ synthase [Bacteroidales bacterium]
MKIALCQLNYHIGHFDQNIQRITDAIQKAKKAGANLAVFAELAVSGYPPRDFLDFDDFITRCETAVQHIASFATGIGVILGAPVFNKTGKGKRLFNAALFLNNGKVEAVSHKALLPNYDIFDEYRYFEPGREFATIDFMGERIALTVCEDLWNVGSKPLYTFSPMDELIKQSPTLMINIAASPFHSQQAEIRRKVLTENVDRYKIPLLYVNHVGAQTELLFDGGSVAIASDGSVAGEACYFEPDMLLTDTQQLRTPNHLFQPVPQNRIGNIHDALVMGIKNYFEKLGFTKAILGLSGGIDSAVVLALAARALGPENVLGVLLPSRFSSDHSVDDALELTANLGTQHAVVSIEDAFQAFEKTLSPHFKGLPFGLAEENLQARSRAVILMALSNKFGHILLNTSNKSEAAVGYGTLYGDMSGGLSVIGDVYKTDVFALAHYINKQGIIIPTNIITKPPSAELRPDQKDSDSLPDYEILDKILCHYIEEFKGPNDLIEMGFEKTLVERVLRMVNQNEYKRHQTPPILRISQKAFGMGRRMPIVARYLS